MKNRIKKYVFEHKRLYTIAMRIRGVLHNSQKGYVLQNHGLARLDKDIKGSGNLIVINEGCVLNDVMIHIRGNNNKIVFDNKCIVGTDCSFWMEGDNISIQIGAGSTFTNTVHFCAQENNSCITVGEDCMFSNSIIVRTSDSHPIYDVNTNERINPAGNVKIGNHVWIAPNSKVMKGAVIGSNSIIGSDSMVTKEIPSNCLAVGHPARIIKHNIQWAREGLFQSGDNK